MFNPVIHIFQTRLLPTLSYTAITLILISIGGCRERIECDIPSIPPLAGNAGCLSVRGNKILLVEQRNGKYSIPGGTATRGESAQCTAKRETQEETGLSLEIGKLLTRFDNNFYLFQCIDTEKSSPYANDLFEVSKAVWLEIDKVPAHKWRYNNQWPIIKALALKLEQP